MTWFKIAFAAQFCMREHNNFFNAFSVAFYWKYMNFWRFNVFILFFSLDHSLSLSPTHIFAIINFWWCCCYSCQRVKRICVYIAIYDAMYAFIQISIFFPLFNIYMKHLALLLRFHSIHILKQFLFFSLLHLLVGLRISS